MNATKEDIIAGIAASIMMFALGVLFSQIVGPIIAPSFDVNMIELATGWFIFGGALLTFVLIDNAK